MSSWLPGGSPVRPAVTARLLGSALLYCPCDLFRYFPPSLSVLKSLICGRTLELPRVGVDGVFCYPVVPRQGLGKEERDHEEPLGLCHVFER